jgi:hypothetical protein
MQLGARVSLLYFRKISGLSVKQRAEYYDMKWAGVAKTQTAIRTNKEKWEGHGSLCGTERWGLSHLVQGLGDFETMNTFII